MFMCNQMEKAGQQLENLWNVNRPVIENHNQGVFIRDSARKACRRAFSCPALPKHLIPKDVSPPTSPSSPANKPLQIFIPDKVEVKNPLKENFFDDDVLFLNQPIEYICHPSVAQVVHTPRNRISRTKTRTSLILPRQSKRMSLKEMRDSRKSRSSRKCSLF